MKLGKQTVEILKSFSSINTNLVIKPGKKISTISAAKDVLAEYSGEDEFDKQVSIFNLNEFLGVVGAFDNPDFDFDDKQVTISEGKQKVKYVYADESLLTKPGKSINMPTPEVEFVLSAANLSKVQKMSGVLGVEDVAFVGNGKNIVARVFDIKNQTGSTFDIDLDTKTSETFDIHFKMDKLKLMSGMDYDVEISSKKISKFTSKSIDLVVFVAVETTSTF